jgi:Fur family peroxide stress response transcriptional regulator
MSEFRRSCVEKGLAVTHQRMVIYRVLSESAEHPSPEMLYERVRKEIPSISLGTIYKNLKTFSDAGLITEVSLHHETLRVDAHTEPHHHLVCIRCKSVSDLEEEDIAPVRVRKRLPKGFTLQRISVEIQGLCAKCAAQGPPHASVE